MKQLVRKISIIAIFSLGLGVLSGCTDSFNTSTYQAGDVGQANRVVPARVVSMRFVRIDNNSGVGGLTGAVVGGVAGSAIGGGSRANIIGAVGGAVVGGLLGNAVEKGVRKNQGIEYVLKSRQTGDLLTVTQLQDINLQVGQKVLIIYGRQTRVVPDTRG